MSITYDDVRRDVTDMVTPACRHVDDAAREFLLALDSPEIGGPAREFLTAEFVKFRAISVSTDTRICDGWARQVHQLSLRLEDAMLDAIKPNCNGTPSEREAAKRESERRDAADLMRGLTRGYVERTYSAMMSGIRDATRVSSGHHPDLTAGMRVTATALRQLANDLTVNARAQAREIKRDRQPTPVGCRRTGGKLIP